MCRPDSLDPDPEADVVVSGGYREGAENVDDLVAGFERMTQGPVEADLVDVVTAALGQVDVAGFDEVVDDAVNGAFTDTDFAGDLGESNFGVLSDADHDVGVVGQKRP